MNDTTSKHLRTSTELTLIAPIKRGFVENVETMTYASRLRLLLNVLYELRKGADERSPAQAEGGAEFGYIGPLERLQTLHFVQWAVFDDDTKLMLNVTFDRSWESYIRDIVDIAGPLLDVILCHCAGYEGHSTDLGYEAFSEWVREHQVENDFFFAAEPGLTADDQRIHKRLSALPWQILSARKPAERGASIAHELEQAAARLRVTIAKPTGGALADLQRIASALLDLRRYFADDSAAGHASHLSASARQDLIFFDEVAYELLSGLEQRFEDPVHTPSEKRVADWYRTLRQRKRMQPQLGAAEGARVPLAALQEIQRGLLTPFPDATHGCLVLLQWTDRRAGASLLKALRRRISIEGRRRDDEGTLSLALTFRGLASLDLSDDELRGFPKEFREGMEARSGILGDIEAAHPSEWQLPQANWPAPSACSKDEPRAAGRVALGSVDAVLLLQRNAAETASDFEWSDAHPLHDDVRELLRPCPGVRVLHVQALRREYQGKAMIEHFGFRDDVSQPHAPFEPPEGSEPRAVLARDEVAPGEIVLGYPNARGEITRYRVNGVHDPERDLLRNGSFLVLRKLEQHVSAFESYVREGAAAVGIEPDELKAQMMGRKPGAAATPLAALCLDPDDDASREEIREQQALNSFDFSEEGNRCPFHAHIRRINPRDADETRKDRNTIQRKTPRILRRSFPYGPPASSAATEEAGRERGLMFMALNAGIADQYEILQRWVSGGNSTGLSSSLADLIAGSPTNTAFAVDTPHGLRWLPAPSEPLVSLRWGLYAFVPSMRAIDQLVARAEQGESFAEAQKNRKLAVRGLGLIAALERLPETAALPEWKRLLEDRAALADTRALWAGVLLRGGALRTPYGVLVAGKRNVYEVLKRSDTYSVREYWRRMEDSIGGMHLGMDPDRAEMPKARATDDDRAYEAAVHPDAYARIAEPLNRAIYRLDFEQGLRAALHAARFALTVMPRGPDGTAQCDLRALCTMVVQETSAQWFGMPSPPREYEDLPDDERSALEDFRRCSAYVFSPNPETWVAEGARRAAGAIRAAVERDGYRALEGVKQAQAQLPADERFPGASDAELAASLKGAAFGYLTTTLGNLLSALAQWVDGGELWRLQQALPTLGKLEGAYDPAQRKEDLAVVQRAILAAMQRGPVPAVLHRTVVRPTQLGAVSLVPGDRVVVALATVSAEDPKDVHVMFGGRYEAADRPVHACPGRELAMGVMTGVMWTLLEQRDLRRISSLSPLKLSFAR